MISTLGHAHGVATAAYHGMVDGVVPRDPALLRIGAKHGKSAAQVALRWLIQHGVVALSKSAGPGGVAENFALFDFALSVDDRKTISGRSCPDGGLVSPPGLAPAWDT